jgi:seryl-tRNA synthetase
MLDIRLIRENPDFVRERLLTRGDEYDKAIDAVLAIDSDRRRLQTEVQHFNAERNKLSKEIGQLRAQKKPSEDLENQVRSIGEQITALNGKLILADENQAKLLLSIPNLPHAQIPLGPDETANPILREWGEKPVFSFEPKDHVELATQLHLLDFERATKISGSGFLCFTGQGAKLQRALIQYLLDLHTTQHGYTEVAPPYFVRRDCMVGTGQLPKFEEDAYGFEEGAMFAIPTAEVPLTNLHRDEILAHQSLPRYYVAHTPCFRREAGSAGRDTRGMIRVHQFDKVELVKVVLPEKSFEELEALTANAEKVLQQLGLHYRVIELCSGDIGFGMTRTYDIEVWSPGQSRYLEVSSCSNAGDFQARRMNLKFKDTEGKNRFCHTLNGSGTALPRLYIALLENYQQPDGSIQIPEVLRSYYGATSLTAGPTGPAAQNP